MANLNISNLKCHFGDKATLNRMIEAFGKQETAKRMAWLHGGSMWDAEVLIDQFLTDDYVDDKGVKGGDYFWGDL